MLCCIPVQAEENAVEISAPGAVLMEPETKTILYEKDKDTRRSPASVTKIMTLLLIFDHLKSGNLHLTDTVTTSHMPDPWVAPRCFWKREKHRMWKP